MCIGIPMRVVTNGPGFAMCEAPGGVRRIDTMMVGEQPPGTWLFVFLDSAREVLTEEQADSIARAFEAVEKAMSGENVDHLFDDLIEAGLPSTRNYSGSN